MRKIKEDTISSIASNSAGAGGIDGIGIGVRGEPGVKKNLKKKLRSMFPIIKRKSEISK